MNPTTTHLTDKISSLLEIARSKVLVAVNQTMVLTYFEIGRMIVEDEQNGQNRAEYGKQIISEVSKNLTQKFGKGFSVENLTNMRKFYVIYSNSLTLSNSKNYSISHDNELITISQTLSTKSQIRQTTSDKFKLSWSHYLKLMRIQDEKERKFYEIEAYKNNWSLRELQRQYDSALYTRLSLSKNKDEVLKLSEKGHYVEKAKDLIKDSYILEFLDLPELNNYSESDLEQKLIDKLEHFLLELGTGFTFVARQNRISFEEKHFKIDLVFYNRILRCFVLVDLKIGELKHQDIGQMQMYVNYYDRNIKLEDENKTIGIILCQDKSNAVVEYTLPENNEQIFASKYLTILPSKEDLINLIKE
jgi:predicted nuclease of restriction endonuclease-like (RecB) superfamily